MRVKRGKSLSTGRTYKGSKRRKGKGGDEFLGGGSAESSGTISLGLQRMGVSRGNLRKSYGRARVGFRERKPLEPSLRVGDWKEKLLQSLLDSVSLIEGHGSANSDRKGGLGSGGGKAQGWR